jgi:hypothetical protein
MLSDAKISKNAAANFIVDDSRTLDWDERIGRT